MNIPVHLVGSAPGVLNGGSLRFPKRKLRVKALPKNLPDFLEADITPLKIGSKLYVTALEGEGYTLLHSDNTVVVQIKTARTAIVDEIDEDEEELEEGAEATAGEDGGVPSTETDDAAAAKE